MNLLFVSGSEYPIMELIYSVSIVSYTILNVFQFVGISISLFPFMGIHKYDDGYIRNYRGSAKDQRTIWNPFLLSMILDDIQF
jgi:hypothetical protein